MTYTYETVVQPQDPGQQAIERLRRVSSMILGMKRPDNPLNELTIPLLIKPAELETAMRDTRAGGLLLKDGEPFGIDDPEGYYEPFNMKAGDARPVKASVTADSQEFHDGSWICSLETNILYADVKQAALQSITLEAARRYRTPRAFRRLTAYAYAEQGYEGHGYKELENPQPTDTHELLDILEPRIVAVVDLVNQKRAEQAAAEASGNS